jgi:acyl-CoA dehydrogenase
MYPITDLFLTNRLREILPKVQEFLQKELFPLEKELMSVPFFQAEKTLTQLRNKVKQQGLWGLALPESYGGLGLSLLEFGQISELLGRTPLGHYVFNCAAPDIGNMELLIHFGTPYQKETFLKPLIAGEIRSCFAMTEPQLAGSNPVNLATTAISEQDNYVINGHKWFATAADGASFCIVMAVTDPQAAKHQRASMLIVPTKSSGFQMIRNIPIMGEAGEGYMSHSEIKFENCKVSAQNIIGKVNEGFALAQHRLGPGRIHHCMRWIGICERAFEMMCVRAISRNLDENEYLSDKQVIQHWIAEARANINAARLLVLDTALLIDQKGAAAARDEVSTIKFFVSDVLMKTLDKAIQVHGALGITDDLLLSFWYRHERGSRIYDGADEVHKSALAKSILKKIKGKNV